MRRKVFDKRVFQNCQDDQFGKLRIEQPTKNLCIFCKNFVSDAQRILPIQDGIPYRAELAVATDTLDKAIGVKNYAHCQSLDFVEFALFVEPTVQIKFIDFVKTLLVKFARLPHIIKRSV